MSADPNRFEEQAGRERSGIVAEFFDFLKHNKKWWLAPIIIIFLLLGLLVVLTSTGLGPYMYTLF